ncbi:glycosyltransferase family 4 protein [Polaribacter sp. R77954]|uniref:glycosyltransferase family 4 protein n=1 Tax=Polaribacter sp. R77954 TaxID=3093870 RepID=UPI0037C7252A
MNNKKSILLIGPFPKPVTGLSLANEILYKGLKNYNKVDCINMSYHRFEEVLGKFNFDKMLFFIKLNLKAFKIYNYDSIYITIGQSFFGVLKYAIFFLVARIFNKKITVHLHGNQLRKMYEKQSFFKKKLVKGILQLSNYGIVLSSSLKPNLEFFLNEDNIFIVENFVENNLFLSPLENKSKDYSVLKIAYISNLMTEKGVFYLLDSLVSLNKKGLLFEAKFAGNIDKSIETKVMSYFKENNNIEYLGVVRGNKKKELLIWSNTFVFPSYLIEGLPISILEAIITKNEVIATKHPALIDFFKEDGLCFIKEKSTDEIAYFLNEMSSNFNQKRIEKNYNLIKDCTEEKFVSKIEKILNL